MSRRLSRAGDLRAVVVAAVVVLGLLLGGCAAIPMTGAVGKSDPLPATNNPVNFGFRQNPPSPGAKPSAIVEGFVDSGTGIQDDFQVARQYLSKVAAQSWKSDAQTLVYSNNLKINSAVESPDGTAIVDAEVDVQSTVDHDGISTSAAPGTVQHISYSLVQVDGEWRISKAPDGIMLQSGNFGQLFTAYPLYFYDPSFTYAVPDVRWISNKAQTAATQIVKDMLNGPAPYLKGAVASAFPDGMSLVRDSVPINNGVAQVDLSPQPLLDATVKSRQQMQNQLQLTLQLNLNTVTSVSLRADTRTVEVTGGSDPAPPQPVANNQVPDRQVAVSNGQLVSYDNGTLTPIEGLTVPANLNPTFPAMSYTKGQYAFLSPDGNQLYSVFPGQAPELMATGSGFTPPSFAPNDWLWTAAGDGSGTVLASQPAAGKAPANVPAATLKVQWLTGRTVKALRVSRDGSRVLVISEANGVATTQIAGILRNSSDGSPKNLTAPISLTTSNSASSGAWVNETTVAVTEPSGTGNGAVVVELVSLRGEPVQLAPLPNVTSISAGNDVLSIYAQTEKSVELRTGNGWSEQTKGVMTPSFAG